MPAELSFITVCKGRLDHLRQTLPLLTAQANTETVVVDYGCPDGTRNWVNECFPAVRVVAVDDDPGFCLARARNLGAGAATAARLCFIDADIRLNDGFVPWLLQNWQSGHYFRVMQRSRDIWGTVVCSAEDFAGIGGYDEAMRGWGGEDDDLYFRLQDAGCRHFAFSESFLDPIRHDDARRVQYYDIKDLSTGLRLCQVYIAAKSDLARMLGRPLTLQERMQVHEQSRKGVTAIPAGATEAVLQVTLPADFRLALSGHVLDKKLVYRLLPRTGDRAFREVGMTDPD